MIPRFSTYHPGYGHGFFLSKTGVHVYDANPDNFLLHSHYKNEQVFMAGYVEVVPGVPQVVAFPVLLPNVPMVYYNFSAAGFGTKQLPFDVGIKTFTPVPWTYAVSANVNIDAVQFVNHMDVLYARVQYIVMVRAMIPRVLMKGGPGVRSALKVSLPGHNVLTAGLNGIAFDAEAFAFRILKRGEFDQNAPSPSGVSTVTIGFPAQARPPLACIYWRQYGAGGPSAEGHSPYMSINAANQFQYARAIITGNQATFLVQHVGVTNFLCQYLFFVEA